MSKIRVALVCGGKSGEHEVSLASANFVLQALDPAKYDVVVVGITREGTWLVTDSPDRLLESGVTPELTNTTELPIKPASNGLLPIHAAGRQLDDSAVDVVFPVLHGPHGEDGAMQGLFEISAIPYVGSGVLASALAMDKWAAKQMLEQAGLESVPYALVQAVDWSDDPASVLDAVERQLHYPVFVKPCNMGSSVGISKARHRQELERAIALSVYYDRRVIVEQGVDAREVECGVLGNEEPVVSVVGEVRPHHEFYDYEAKYSVGMADLLIPAPLSEAQTKEVQAMARRAYIALDCAGMARVDFFVLRESGKIVVNEVNTIPGFTATSMFPRLWEATGVPFTELVDRLIALAIQRHRQNALRWIRR